MSPGPADGWMSDNMRFHVPDDRSPILKLPLSPGGVNLTGAQRQQYADVVRERVDSILADDEHYTERRDQQLPFLHPNEWKQVQMHKSKELRFYKRVRRGRTLDELAAEEEFPELRQAVKNGYSTMICDGEVKGSLVDMMYGMTASSQEELMTGFWYKNPPKDCVWLGSAEGPTPQDPFHSADFIWAYPDVPAYQLDICYLKATGVEYDRHGNRYGYLVLHSVDLPQCRPFETHKIFRAKMHFTCLFREIRTGVLKVTLRGILDLQHHVKILKKLVSAATTSFIVGLLNGVGIGEAKKLTLLARRNRRGNATGLPKQDACSVCLRRSSFLGRAHILGMHMVQCKVCDATVCSRGQRQAASLSRFSTVLQVPVLPELSV